MFGYSAYELLLIDKHVSLVIIDHRAYGRTGRRITQHSQQLLSIIAYTDTQGVAQLSTRSFDGKSKSAHREGFDGSSKSAPLEGFDGSWKSALLQRFDGNSKSESV